MNLCYIQARGGSKRLPGKNKMLWYGMPFVGDAIMKAEESDLFDVIVVTSDDIEILDIAREYGAVPMLRSEDMGGDFVTDAQLATEVLSPFRKFKVACKLYPCVPLLTTEELFLGYQALNYFRADALRAVDWHGEDAGAFWFYRITDKVINGGLGEVKTLDYCLKVCQDINTIEDIEEARKKYENHRLLDD